MGNPPPREAHGCAGRSHPKVGRENTSRLVHSEFADMAEATYTPPHDRGTPRPPRRR